MPDLVVIVPTRGRPRAAVELAEAFGETRTTAHLCFAIDEDDPTRDDYHEALGVYPNSVIDTGGAPATMVRALNATALKRASAPDAPFAIGFMGDDHRPRTTGWDQAYLDTLRELGTGIVYGNDLLQGANLPTQCAMTSDIIHTLGYMAPPSLTHLFVDDAWKHLGLALGKLRYLEDVVVEHVHPIAGKAEWDPGYVRVNDRAMYARDRAMFLQWQRDSLPAEVERLKKVAK